MDARNVPPWRVDDIDALLLCLAQMAGRCSAYSLELDSGIPRRCLGQRLARLVQRGLARVVEHGPFFRDDHDAAEADFMLTPFGYELADGLAVQRFAAVGTLPGAFGTAKWHPFRAVLREVAAAHAARLTWDNDSWEAEPLEQAAQWRATDGRQVDSVTVAYHAFARGHRPDGFEAEQAAILAELLEQRS